MKIKSKFIKREKVIRKPKQPKDKKMMLKLPPSIKGMTLRSRIIIFLLLFTIIPSVIIGNVVYFVSKNTIESKVSTMNDEIGTQVTQNVNYKLAEIDNLSLVPFTNIDLIEQLKSDDGLSEYEAFNIQRTATEYLSGISFTNEHVKALFFVNKENKIFGEKSYVKSLEIDSFISDVLAKKGDGVTRSAQWVTGFNDNNELLYLYRDIEKNGTLILVADRAIFEKVFSEGKDNSGREISVINEDGTIVSSNQEKLIGTKYDAAKDSQDHLTSINESDNGWQVAVSTSKSYLFKEIQNVIYLVYIIILAFVVLALVASIFLAKSMIKPIHELVGVMKHAEEGDLTHRAEYLYKNEVGQLGTSFNTMIDNIRAMIDENKRVSAYAVNRANDLKRIASESASASEQIASAIEDVAKGAVSQVDYSERTNREMKELSSEINEVSNNMMKVSEFTETTKKVSSQSIETIKELTEKNKEMGTNIGQVDTTMDALNKEISQIKEIVEMIKNVSEETNLLSLNASIEAARAGAAGRGFAVVADEIRKLADQTKTSSLRIETVISSILNQTKKSVELVKTTITLFKEQTSSINNTQEAFENILEGTNSIIDEINHVEVSISKINLNKDKVESAIGEMVDVAEDSSATTEEVTATTEEQSAAADELGNLASALSSTVSELEQTINKFKV
ncbi:methyl-accepting chemotaxis protein [Metabacillus litoralis]|uniref:Methyl-accepting chemotaxis protein n=1 Tax=Metabacillus litoralis TaxID=152268 RepID=A0A5C6W5J4_9BACI|nr:methyl-accepting chemotaxis protein [Metabacillus litoralis]TXC91124.1 methyl-accepting chemotaxis protein [Metabacillus litoralis]